VLGVKTVTRGLKAGFRGQQWSGQCHAPTTAPFQPLTLPGSSTVIQCCSDREQQITTDKPRTER